MVHLCSSHAALHCSQALPSRPVTGLAQYGGRHGSPLRPQSPLDPEKARLNRLLSELATATHTVQDAFDTLRERSSVGASLGSVGGTSGHGGRGALLQNGYQQGYPSGGGGGGGGGGAYEAWSVAHGSGGGGDYGGGGGRGDYGVSRGGLSQYGAAALAAAAISSEWSADPRTQNLARSAEELAAAAGAPPSSAVVVSRVTPFDYRLSGMEQ